MSDTRRERSEGTENEFYKSGGQSSSSSSSTRSSSKQITILFFVSWNFSREFFQVNLTKTHTHTIRKCFFFGERDGKNPTRKIPSKITVNDENWIQRCVSEWKSLLLFNFFFSYSELVFIECDKRERQIRKTETLQRKCNIWILLHAHIFIYRNACEFLCYERQVKMTHKPNNNGNVEYNWKFCVYLISSKKKTEKSHTHWVWRFLVLSILFSSSFFFFFFFMTNVIVMWLYAVFFAL